MQVTTIRPFKILQIKKWKTINIFVLFLQSEILKSYKKSLELRKFYN